MSTTESTPAYVSDPIREAHLLELRIKRRDAELLAKEARRQAKYAQMPVVYDLRKYLPQ